MRNARQTFDEDRHGETGERFASCTRPITQFQIAVPVVPGGDTNPPIRVPIDVYPYMTENDEIGIAAYPEMGKYNLGVSFHAGTEEMYRQAQGKPAMVIYCSTPDDPQNEEDLEVTYDIDRMQLWWSNAKRVSSRRDEFLTFKSFASGVLNAMLSVYGVDHNADDRSYSTWIQNCIATCVPHYCADALKANFSAAMLRNISNAMSAANIGYTVNSAKKEDLASAIIGMHTKLRAEEAGDASVRPLHQLIATDGPSAPDNHSKSNPKENYIIPTINPMDCTCEFYVYQDVFSGLNEPTLILTEQERGKHIAQIPTFRLSSFAKGLENRTHSFADAAITQAKKLGMKDMFYAEVSSDVHRSNMVTENTWKTIEVMTMREQMAAAHAMNDELKRSLDALTAIRNTKVMANVDGQVDVCGQSVSHYGSPNSPAAIHNYCLDFWSASVRFGSGASTVKFSAGDLASSIVNDAVTSLVGPPGTGKTSIVVQLGHVLGCPVSIIQFTRDKPIEQLIGVDKIQNKQQVFVDGEITEAMRAASEDPDTLHFIAFDEFDHAPAEVQSEFHGVVEGRDYVLPSGETIPNHGNMRFVLTRNTTGHGDQTGRHSAANVSDSAFNSRICSAYMVDYMAEENEVALLVSYGMDNDEAKEVVKFANATRESVKRVDSGADFEGMNEPVCLRHMISYAKTRSRSVEKSKALVSCVIAQLPERDRSVANELALANMTFDQD